MFLDRYCRTQYGSYEDFYENFKVGYPENFNFAYDVTDVLAAEQPGKTALVWCNDLGDEKFIDFEELKRQSNKYANALQELGIGDGDVVMAMLKGRYEFWYFILACHKVGAVLIPGTHMLKVKDIVYRAQVAKAKMVLTVNDHELCGVVAEADEQLGNTLV